MTTQSKRTPSGLRPTLNADLSTHFYKLRDRALLALGESENGGRAVVLTSSHPGEGTSTVALNFALAVGQTEKGRILLVDANLANPSLHEALGMSPGPGLADIVGGSAKVEEAIRPSGADDLYVVTAGSKKMNPAELTKAKGVEDLLAVCREQYTLSIFDAPPVMDYNATALLAAATDGAILVVEAERERWEVTQRATSLMQDAGARVLGAVLNKRKFHIPRFLYDWV
jgi:capsular exopolysaccharide synthesis family protein